MSKILVVDDEPDQLVLITKLLQAGGHEVTTAETSVEALRHIGTGGSPDVVLLDVSMPGKSGFELARLLRDHERTSHVPVIFLTSAAHHLDIEEGTRLGDTYLIKPATQQQLLDAVDHAVA